jgi:hypothetical protein
MKYVFLDIDGVLNCREFFEKTKPAEKFEENELSEFERNLAHVGKEYVQRLNGLVDVGRVAFVLSSTWRILSSVNHVEKVLKHQGFEGNLIGATPVQIGKRGREIASWLVSATGTDAFNRATSKDWPKFVILDDDSDMLHLEGWLVKTDNQFGLQDEHIEKARAKLGLDN